MDRQQRPRGLGQLPGTGIGSVGTGISADGSVVVGTGTSTDFEAFRWTSSEGMVGLGFLPGRVSSRGTGVSGDGSIVVGSSSDENFASEAFRWTAATGMVGLGDLVGGDGFSIASAVSSDGTAIVGISSRPGAPDNGEAFRWTSSGGMVGLGNAPDGRFLNSRATAVSADGAVIVGNGDAIVGEDLLTSPFIWDADHGMRPLQDLLANEGVDLTGWTLDSATGISGDGRAIVGFGSNPSGRTEAWLVIIPEPATALLLALGLTPSPPADGTL